MKKMFAMMLALSLLLCLAACGGEQQPEETTAAPQVIVDTQTVEETTAPVETEEAPAPQASADPFCITLEGVELIPGQVYDAAAMPEPNSVYQVPSCAIEGTDNVYSFDAAEITAFDDGTNEIIYSVVLVDPNVATDEGLMLGDKVEKVIELYGESYVESGTAMVYTGGNTQLSIIIQNGYVVDIEYVWIVE